MCAQKCPINVGYLPTIKFIFDDTTDQRLHRAAAALSAGKPAECLEVLGDERRLGDPTYMLVHAGALFKQQRYGDCIALIVAYLQVHPKVPLLVLLRANCLEAQGDLAGSASVSIQVLGQIAGIASDGRDAKDILLASL
jgi:hypothetical protein